MEAETFQATNQGRLIKLGEGTSADEQEQLVRGRLVANVTQGTDKGALSAKILGSDRRVNMWQPESMTGVIVIGTPKFAVENKEKLLETPEDV